MTTNKDTTTARIAAWLASEERGTSSEAIAFTTLGAYVTGRRAAWPLDSTDLRRCLQLIQEVPEAREQGLRVLAERHPEWAALESIWDRLSATLRSEIGDVFSTRRSAPKTYELLKEALSPTFPS